MTDASDRERILLSLRDRPSVASAIAIGHYHVLNGAPARIALLALEALERMPCDWMVVILEQAALHSGAHPSVRRMAACKICRLLASAIERGYGRISFKQVRVDAFTLRMAVGGQPPFSVRAEELVDHLCGHLAEAIAEGCFGELPVDPAPALKKRNANRPHGRKTVLSGVKMPLG